ncbi:MAG: CopG family transcriptional regulator [Candidatus Coatesbacteria bacterium]
MKDTLTIRLPARDRKELEDMARENGTRVSAVVRDSIRRTLALRDFRRACEIAEPYARAKGIFTDEDVFKLIS